MSALKLDPKSWQLLYEKIKRDNLHLPKSTWAIRQRMKERLGFLPRTHESRNSASGSTSEIVCLDFYDDVKKTMFLLKYSGFLTTEARSKRH